MKASLSSLGIPFGFLNLYCIYRDLLSPTIIPHIVFFPELSKFLLGDISQKAWIRPLRSCKEALEQHVP